MRTRILMIAGSVALALGLIVATLAAAQGPPTSTDTEAAAEAQREAAAALAAEAGSLPELDVAEGLAAQQVISAPLFIGVSDTATPAYLVHPATGNVYPLFDGFEIWGAAYDAAGQRLFFNRGITLYVWPIDGVPTTLGAMKSQKSGANLSMAGLAFTNGTLYGSRGVGTVDDPEGVYTINPATRVAKLAFTYQAGAAKVDIGGLAAAPGGALYGTNDQAGDFQGLVQLGNTGVLTVIAPYPDGEIDIDGLAIGDGKAFLVTDEPGPLHVYDFATQVYTSTYGNPWTSTELFSAADWIAPSIELAKTVGTDPSDCATTDTLDVPFGTEVTYCYEITNTGPISLGVHDLTDSSLGTILDGSAAPLAPGASMAVTRTATLTTTTTNSATWTAYREGPSMIATASDTATVTVPPTPQIVLTKTVGFDPDTCATTSELTIPPGTDVTYCYRVTNTGNLTLGLHDLEDSALGPLADGLALDLDPGASATLTETVALTETTTNTAIWTAYNEGPTDVVTATATAHVTVTELLPEIGVTPASLKAEVPGGGSATRLLTVSNSGQSELTWTIGFAPNGCSSPGTLPWVSAAPQNGTTAAGESAEVTVTFNAAGLVPGNRTGVLCVTSNDVDEPVVSVPLTFTVGKFVLHFPIIAKN